MIAAGADEAVGIDINAEVVAFARARTEALGSAATFRLAAIDDVGGADLRDFDVVYARCVLSHLPDPRAAMAALWRGVAPGGVLMIEDVEVAATWGSPPSAALARYRELYVAAANANGASPAVGAELACFLHDLGATEVEVDLIQPVLHARGPDDPRGDHGFHREPGHHAGTCHRGGGRGARADAHGLRARIRDGLDAPALRAGVRPPAVFEGERQSPQYV
jgi:SAM-dependent methyltransferase